MPGAAKPAIPAPSAVPVLARVAAAGQESERSLELLGYAAGISYFFLGVCLRFDRFGAGRPGVRTRVLSSEVRTIWDERSEDTLANSRWVAVPFFKAAKEWQR